MPFRSIREVSLRQLLLLLTVVTSGIGVLLGCIGFLAYDMHVARQEKLEELRSTGELIGMNSTAALEFGDELAGAKLLASLSTRPDIRAGILYRADGTRVAYYVRADLNSTFLPTSSHVGSLKRRENPCPMHPLTSLNCWRVSKMTANSCVIFC